MPGSFFRRDVDRPVHFRDPADTATVDGRLESVKLLEHDDGARELVLVVWFDYWTFKRIDRARHFGYTFESIDREGFQGWELTSDSRVQLELRAEPALVAPLAGLPGEALVDRVIAALADDAAGSPFLDVDGYRYLAAYQAKEMGGVTYLSGFTSIYRKQRGA